MNESIITRYPDISVFTGAPAECKHHLVFGRGLRELADKDGLWIPLTNKEHNMGSNGEKIHGNMAAEKLSKIAGQLAWEKEYYRKGRDGDPARAEFMRRYGRSYL